MPEPQGYALWKDVRSSMIVHTRGVLPKKLLETKRPNEPAEIRDYRLSVIRKITKSGINSAIDSVFRIFLGSNYSITPSEDIKEYIAEKRFTFIESKSGQMDFESVFFRHVLRKIFDDPNGFLVWMPVHSVDRNLPPAKNEANEPIEVEPLIVPSVRVKDVQDDVFSFEAKEKAKIKIPLANNRFQEKEKPYYFIITKEAIWRLYPYWDDKEIKYKNELWYNLSMKQDSTGMMTDEVSEDKKFPELPVHVLGGNNTEDENDTEYLESFFAAYLPFADEAINLFSDNQAVNVRYSFPFVEIKGQKCYTCDGAGKIPKKEDGKPITCQTCNGRKTVPVLSPFGQYIMEPPASGENEAFALADAVKFHHADVGILEHSFKVWEILLTKAEEAISVKFIEDAQSGVAKDIDRERKYEMLMNISHNLFKLIKWSLDMIQAYKEPFVDERKESVVKPPTSFSIKTVRTLTQELFEMQEKSTPASYIANTARELARKTFNENDKETKIVDILTTWDVLYGKTDQQISILKATGGATLRDVIRHVNGYSILSKIDMEQEPEEIIKQAEANLVMPVQIPQIRPDGTIEV